jgi:hypothetical protein
LARGHNAAMKHIYIAISLVLISALGSCSSPLDLDVDRSVRYIDNVVSPHRAALFYYFADSAYEAIYSDARLLGGIKIDTSVTPARISIVQINSPRFLAVPSFSQPVMVEAFGFGLHDHPADETVRDVVNGSTFLNVNLLQSDNVTTRSYLWFIDGVSRRLRIGFIHQPEKRVVKGRIIINIIDPHRNNAVATYYGLLTLDY